MKAASSSEWRELARLGEQLIGETSLSVQRDRYRRGCIAPAESGNRPVAR